MVETIISLGFISLILAAVVPLFMVGIQGPQEVWKKEASLNMASGTLAALKALKDENWNNIYRPTGTANKGDSNPYHLVEANGSWVLNQGEGQTVLNGVTFNSQIVIENVSRTGKNGAGEIEKTYEALREDPSSQKITIQISAEGLAPIKEIEYLTRTQNSISDQTDWTAANSFSSSNQIETAKPGQITLTKQGSAPFGNGFVIDSSTVLYRLNSSSKKVSMRFTAKKTGLVNQVRVYISRVQSPGSTVYRYGLQNDNNGQPSGNWLAFGTARTTNAIGWQTINLIGNAAITEANVYHLVVQFDSGQPPSNSRYIEIRASSPLNNLYPLDGKADPNANCLTSDGPWQVVNQQPIYVLGFSDLTFEGNPYDSSATSQIYQNNIEGEKFTLKTEEELTGVNLYVAKSSSSTPADSLKVKLTDLDSTTVLADEVMVGPNEVTKTLAWKTHNFGAPITLTANHTFRLEFYSTNAKNNNSYIVLDVSTPNNQEYIDLTWQGTDAIATRSTGGNPFSDLIFVDLAYQLMLGGSGYAQKGELVSSTFNLINTGGAGFNRLSWQATVPAKTAIKFKLAANADNATWRYLGPNGTEADTDYYSFDAGENIWQGFSREGDYYIRYKVILTGDGTNTPTLDSVRINWAK